MRTSPKSRVTGGVGRAPAGDGQVYIPSTDHGHVQHTRSLPRNPQSGGSLMYVYMTTDLTNGMRYVGQCRKTPETSTRYLGSGHWLTRAINAHGRKHFTKIILEDGITDAPTLSEREKHWIAEMDTMKPNGYNLNEGGSIYVSPSLSVMEAKKAAQRLRRGPLNKKYGTKMSPEQYAKMRPYWDSQKGKPTDPEVVEKMADAVREPVVQLQLDGGYVATFPSRAAAGQAIKRGAGGISECVFGDRLHCKGYRFMSLEDYDIVRSAGATVAPLVLPPRKQCPTARPIVQLSESGAYIATFINMATAARDLDIGLTGIRECLHGRSKWTAGFSFMHEDEYHLALSAGAIIGPFSDTRKDPKNALNFSGKLRQAA